LTAIIGRRDKKKKMSKANSENDPQEVRNDEATEQYVFRDKDYQTLWHQNVQKLPPGQIINIPYLKTLESANRQLVPIAYCLKGDIDQVKNFVPGYLARVNRHLWELYDEEDYIMDTFSWNEGKNTLLDIFGTSIQHPEEHFVQYFGGTKATPIEKGSQHHSPRKNPPETYNTDERGLSSFASPGCGGADLPGQGEANKDNIRGQEGLGGVDGNAAGQRKGEKETGQGGICPPVVINEKASPRRSTRKNPPETDHDKGRGLSSIEST
jgi:hypothetical protein